MWQKTKFSKHVPQPNWFLHSRWDSNILTFSRRKSSNRLFLRWPPWSTRVTFQQVTWYRLNIILAFPRCITTTIQLQTFTRSTSRVWQMTTFGTLQVPNYYFSTKQMLSTTPRNKLWNLSNSKRNFRPSPEHCPYQQADQALTNLPFTFISSISY
jgi:hypothetical protein